MVSVAEVCTRNLFGRDEGVVVLKLQNSIFVFGTKIFESGYGITVEVITKAKVRVKLHYKTQWRRNVFVNFCYHNPGTKIRENRIKHPIIIAVDVQAKNSEIWLDVVLAQKRCDVVR